VRLYIDKFNIFPSSKIRPKIATCSQRNNTKARVSCESGGKARAQVGQKYVRIEIKEKTYKKKKRKRN
jgi:hypothetical protein